MIPEQIEPNQAPGGIVAIAFDLENNEITRSLLSAERVRMSDWAAADAGMAASERGGGFMVAYDGDTGEKMLTGPRVVLDANGRRMAATHEIESLGEAVHSVKASNGGHWPWEVMGIFPVFDDESEDDEPQWWNYFCYTVNFPRGAELWVPCCSIERHCAHPDLIASMLNIIGAGIALGFVDQGDTVRVPLGVPDADDVDTYWWIGHITDDWERYQTYQSPSPWVVPIRWSSGLGWRDDDREEPDA